MSSLEQRTKEERMIEEFINKRIPVFLENGVKVYRRNIKTLKNIKPAKCLYCNNILIQEDINQLSDEEVNNMKLTKVSCRHCSKYSNTVKKVVKKHGIDVAEKIHNMEVRLRRLKGESGIRRYLEIDRVKKAEELEERILYELKRLKIKV